MRLLNTRTKILEEFVGDNIPKYAILSHTWGLEELTYSDFMASGCLPPNIKIDGCCSTALDRELEYVWIDTICIDKSSSAELSEAINSMYEWYRKAEVCFAYLSDVSCNASTPIADIASSDSDFSRSRWFTRGWTLQELIAPYAVSFFNNRWELIGHKRGVFGNSYAIMRADEPAEVSILTILRQITNIPLDVLAGQTRPASISVAARMMWAAKRQTTRREDMAYCLLGLFSINMTMLYGEGDRAFRRLQEEIIRTSDDESIFAWGFGCATSDAFTLHNGLYIEASTLLASSPADFVGCNDVRPLPSDHSWRKNHATHYVMTNKGLLIERPILALPREFNTSLLPLNCCVADRAEDHIMRSHTKVEEIYLQVLALPLRGVLSQDARLQVYQACRVVMVDITVFDQTDPSVPAVDRTRIYADISPHGYFVGPPRRTISLYVMERLPVSPLSFSILEVYPGWSYFPNSNAILNTNDLVGVFVDNSSIELDNELTLYTIIRIRCSNNKNYLLRFYPVPPEDGPYVYFFQRTGLDWRVGILSDDPGDLVLRRILRATPGSELSTTFMGPCPTISDDGYVKVGLEVIERPGLGGVGGKFSLTIRCGGQEESPTKEMDQSAAKVLRP